ncbi:MAG: hypothetical protein CME65_04015 [Halobacteriovoraceae bacterium]|nr:hypothetical protein [Halobacteriovoraceae bacterium]|tara:strand:+ start:1714 stop:2958 length:1245 start_codon:yes stop_codon:yes gene_type:complete
MSFIGFGCYRVSNRSEEHRDALSYALDQGVSLIDTSSNYTDGESEKLVGEVLASKERDQYHVISKIGYIQGQNLETYEELNIPSDEVVHFAEGLKHCIHPVFIEDQVKRSLERLQLNRLDTYLLHNPEYYLKTEGSEKKEYYRRIQQAFEKLEELVERGLILQYGISSNTFVDPREDHTSTDLDIVMGAARSVKEDNNFKMIQFPFNILEMGAIERQYDGDHLIERAHKFGLKTVGNRPLNSFTDHGLLRLATYPIEEIYKNSENAEKLFNKCIEPLVIKWLEVRESEDDKLFDLPLMKQMSQIWYKQNSRDAVDQIFYQYFYPFIARVWGSDLSVNDSQTFYDLHEHAFEFAKHNMNERALMFERQALDKGLLRESDLTLSQKVIEKYQSFGLDHVLVGMKDKAYVDDLSAYF